MRRGELTDRLLSGAAAIVAVAALGTAVYTAWITREQQKISIWPYVVQENSDSGAMYRRLVVNAGLGPALVRSFDVRVDGKPVHGWAAVFHAGGIDTVPRGVLTSSLGNGSVLRPGQELTILMIPDSAVGLRFHAHAVPHMETIVCYCSLYGDCWRADSRRPNPERTDCASAARRESDQG